MKGKSAVPVQIVMFIVYLMKNSSMYLKNYEEKNLKLYSLLKVKVKKSFFFFFQNFASSPLWIGSMENKSLNCGWAKLSLSRLLHLWMVLGTP